MVYNNVLEAVGHTPMIRLSSRMVGEDCARVLVKYEGLNVGGSIKTRTALNMIEQAEKDGKITKDTIIVEPTSSPKSRSPSRGTLRFSGTPSSEPFLPS